MVLKNQKIRNNLIVGNRNAKKKRCPKREILPDPMYHSELLAKFINVLMVVVKNLLLKKLFMVRLDKL